MSRAGGAADGTPLAAAGRGGDEPAAGRRGGLYGLLLRDSVIYGSGRMLQKFLSALLLPLYTSYLTPADYGVLGMVLVTATFIDVIVTLGFDVAFARFFFDEPSDAHRSNVVTTVYPGILLGLLALFMPQISHVIMGQGGYALYFDVALVNVFFTNWSDLAFQLFRLEHRPYIFTVFNLGRIVVQIPLTVVLVVAFRMGVMGVLVGNAVTAFLICMGGLPTYWRRLNWRPDPGLLRPMFAFAIPAVFTGLVFFLLKLSDRFFLMRYRGQKEVGLYTAAFTISQPVYLAMTAFRMAWPQWHYARLHEPERHKQLVARSSTYFLFVCVAMLVLQGAFMPLLVRVLLRQPAFWVVGPTTLLLTIATVAYSAYFVFWTGANVAKKNRLIPVITAVASGLNIGLNFLLVPKYGMIAAAWTTLIGYIVLAALMYPISEHYYPIPFEWARFLKLGAGATLSLLAAWGIAAATHESASMPFGQLAWRETLKLAAVLLFPLALGALHFFTPGETARLHTAVTRVGRLLRPGAPAARAAASGSALPGARGLDAEAAAAEDDELVLENEARLTINEADSPT